MIAINSFTKQTFENLKTKYGATSFLSKDFENMKYLGMYVIDDYNPFKKACEQAKTLDTFETFEDSINTINSFLQNNLRSSDYSEDFKCLSYWIPVIPIKDCLKRLQNTIEEINYAIKSVDQYSAKISKTIMIQGKPLTTSEKIAQIAEVFFANSLIYDDSSSQKLMELMFCCSSDWNGFKEVNALLAENAFTPEGAQQIESIIDSIN
jgi:hypothetical protein